MKRLTVLGVCVLLLLGCSDKKPPIAELPPPEVTASPVYENDKEIDTDTFEGRIAAVSTIDVRMRGTGYLLDYNFAEGSEVKEGTVLFEIDPRDYDVKLKIAQEQLKSYEARVARLNEDFDRVERLKGGGGISREEYDKVKGDRLEAIAAKDAAVANVEKAKLDLSYCKYVAPPTKPKGGTWRVDRVQVTPGNLILADNTILTTLISIDPVYVNFDVDERSLLRYQRNAQEQGKKTSAEGVPLKDLKIECKVGLDSDDGFPLKGMLDFSASKLDPSTGTYPVRGVLFRKENGNRILTPGLRARVQIAAGDPYKAILVNERAILTDQKRRYVYVLRGDKAERVDVELGTTHGQLVVVKGLNKDDKVIVNNIQRVRPEMKVNAKIEPMPGVPK